MGSSWPASVSVYPSHLEWFGKLSSWNGLSNNKNHLCQKDRVLSTTLWNCLLLCLGKDLCPPSYFLGYRVAKISYLLSRWFSSFIFFRILCIQFYWYKALLIYSSHHFLIPNAIYLHFYSFFSYIRLAQISLFVGEVDVDFFFFFISLTFLDWLIFLCSDFHSNSYYTYQSPILIVFILISYCQLISCQLTIFYPYKMHKSLKVKITKWLIIRAKN